MKNKTKKSISAFALILSLLLLLTACGGETPQEKAQRQSREAWKAYQDANEAYERANKEYRDFNNAVNSYKNARNALGGY